MYKNSSFVIAAVISIAVHATAAVYLGHYAAPSASQPQSAAHVLQISLAPATPAAPQPEPPPKPEVKREPLPEPVIKPRPESTEVAEIAKPIEVQVTASAYPEAPINKPALTEVALENERESYMLQLLAHIDSHKFYPRSARRRGIEGKIQVVFYLLRDGSISDLQIKGGNKILRNAAKQAVQQSLALPPPPESMRLQEQIRFGMVYRLDG